MPIREIFHVMHMVRDFDACSARFEALFAPQTFAPKSWSDFDKRFASLAVIGPDMVWELMESSTDPADADYPLPKFTRRFGDHLHSFAWFVDKADMPDLFRRLRAGGVRVAGQRGLVPPGEIADEDVPNVMFTHGQDTLGQIEFMGIEGPPRDPRGQNGFDAAFWRDQHPMGVVRTSHVTNAVVDMDRARTIYVDLLGGIPFHSATTDARRSEFVLVGKETVVELAQPLDTASFLAHDVAKNGALPHGMTFAVKDLDAAVAHIEACGVRVAERTADTAAMHPDDMFGSVYAVTTARLPGDPRDA